MELFQYQVYVKFSEWQLYSFGILIEKLYAWTIFVLRNLADMSLAMLTLFQQFLFAFKTCN